MNVMNIQLFLALLFGFSILTSLITEAIKKLFPKCDAINIVATITGVMVGCGGTFIYYFITGMAINMVEIVYAILLGFASGLCAMVGFDKVKEALIQCGLVSRNKDV